MNKRNKGIVLSYSCTVLNMICGLFLSSFLLRMLGDKEYGIYQTVAAFATYLVLLEFGTGTVMTRNILVYKNAGNEEKIKNVVSTVWVVTLVLSLFIAIASVIFYFNIGNIYSQTMTAHEIIYSKKIFVVMSGYLIVSFFSQTVSGVLLGMENYTFGQVIKIANIILRVLFLTSLVFFQRTAMVIALVDLALGILRFLVTFLYIKKTYKIKIRFRYFDFSIVKESAPLCISILLQAFVNQANNNVDKTVLGIMVSMESVAIYAVAQYIYTMFSSFTTIPISMYMPQIAKDMAKGIKGKELTKTLVQPSKLVTIIGGMIIGGFFAVGKQFITIVYGKSKEEVWIYALIIMIPMFINMTTGVINNILDVLNKRIVRSLVLTFTTILNIILTVLVVPKAGIIGAIIATAISTLIGQIIIMNIYYSKKLGLAILYLFKTVYKKTIIFISLSSVASFMVAKLISNDIIAFIVGGMLFVLLSFGSILFFGLDQNEKQMLKNKLSK